MGLDIWFSEDIRNALLAANEASAATAEAASCGDVAILRAYRKGYKAALSVVALAFGIAPQGIQAIDNRLTAEPGTKRFYE